MPADPSPRPHGPAARGALLRNGLAAALGWNCLGALAQDEPDLAAWAAGSRALAADPAVVAWYDFQEGQGETLHNRAGSGAALDGILRSAVWDTGRWPGKRALRFDGRSSVVEIPASPLLGPAPAAGGAPGEFAVEIWVLFLDDSEAGLVDRSSAGTGLEAPYGLWLSPKRLFAFVCGEAPGAIAAAAESGDAPLGEWTHVVLNLGPRTLSLYRDGSLVGQAPRPAGVPRDNGRPLLLGAMSAAPEARFHLAGLIDEVAIYRRALSEEEIRARARLRGTAPAGTLRPLPPDAALELLAPVGGETLAAGSTHTVRWAARGAYPRGTLSIEVSADGGATWVAAGRGECRAGEALWRVPDAPGDAYALRLTDPRTGLQARTRAPFRVVPSQAAAVYRWVQVLAEAPFAARDGAGALSFQGRIWLLGGWNPRDKNHFPRICNNEVWASADGTRWDLVKPNTFLGPDFDPASDWAGRHTAGYVVHRDRLWIVGGDALQGQYQNDVWNSADGRTWTCVAREVPWGPRVLAYTAAFRGRIWVLGGQTTPQFAPAPERFYRDLWASEDGVRWEKIEPEEPFWPQRGMIGGSAVFRGRLWVLGGGTYDTPGEPRRKFYNDVWSSADGIHWECHLERAPWAPRQYHEVAVFDDRLWVLEGYSGANRNDVWYSQDGTNWYQLPDTPWAPRHAASVTAHDGALWVIAGNNMQPDVWKLVRDPAPAP